MSLTFSKRWLLLPGVILLIVGGLIAHALEGADISYPIDTWRMDLDDLTSNIIAAAVAIGTLILAAAAWKQADRAESKAKRIEHQINGGMGEIAREHVNGALKKADVELGLWRRVDALEDSNQQKEQERLECEEFRAECMKENEKLRKWVIARLDSSTDGRQGER